MTRQSARRSRRYSRSSESVCRPIKLLDVYVFLVCKVQLILWSHWGMYKDGWNVLQTEEVISLGQTLFSGQVFGFRKTGEEEYTGVVGRHLVTFLQGCCGVLYKTLHEDRESRDVASEISHFFTLDVPLQPLLDRWRLDMEEKLVGLRILRHELVPTIFSFICSSNNNVARITRMVNFLYSKGDFIANYKGFDFHQFPRPEVLLDVEEELRRNGFGYRSRYVCDAARFLVDNHSRIAGCSPGDARKMLVSIRGIGNKVADCILLVGMGDLGAVPVDTHVFNFSKRHFGIRNKALTDKIYRDIQRLYREEFGEYAGIAQLYIFKKMLDSRQQSG